MAETLNPLEEAELDMAGEGKEELHDVNMIGNSPEDPFDVAEEMSKPVEGTVDPRTQSTEEELNKLS